MSDWEDKIEGVIIARNTFKQGKSMQAALYERLAMDFYKKGHRNHDVLFQGLAEEVVEVVEANSEDSILDELGDVLWYVTAIANQMGSSLDSVMLRNINKLERREINGKK